MGSGSQHTAFWKYGDTADFRFDVNYVKSTYKVEQMLGKRGGGFIFDTNTVHRGMVDGRHLRRDVVVIDIESVSKLEAKLPGKGPCPEGDLRLVPGRVFKRAGLAQ